MAITYIAVSSANEAASGNLTLTEPSGAQQGDLLVACIAYRSTAAFTVPSAEWTVVATQQSSGNTSTTTSSSIASGLMAYCVRGSSAPSYAFTRTAGDVAIGRVLCYRGVDQTTPYDTGSANTLGSNSATVTTTTITPSVPDCLLVMACCFADNTTASAQTSATAPTSAYWDERVDSNTTTGADTGLAVADSTKLSAAATGTLQYTAGNSSRHVCIVGAFRPAYRNISRTLQLSSRQQLNDQSSYTTASFTPPDRSLVVLCVAVLGDNGDIRTGGAVAGGSLAWSSRASGGATNGGFYCVCEIWTAPVTTGASMTITYTPAVSADYYEVAVYTVIGHNEASPVGGTGSLTTFASDTTPIVLSASPAIGSLTFAARFHSPNDGSSSTSASPGSGWTESYDNYLVNYGGMAVQERWDSTSVNCPWTDANVTNAPTYFWGAAAAEIKGSPSLLPPGPTSAFAMVHMLLR